VLRSLNRRIVVRLFANNIHLALYRKWPRQLIATRQISTHDQELPQLLTTATRALSDSDWHGGVQLVIGNRWLRFAALPWNLQTGHPEKDQMTASVLCADMLGVAETTPSHGASFPWTIMLDMPRHGHDRLVAAIRTDLVQHLFSFSTDRHPLAMWQPWISCAWDIFRKQQSLSKGTLYIPEPGCLTLITHSEGTVRAIQQRFFPPNDPGALLSLLRMEQLQHNQPLTIVADAIPAHWQTDLQEFGKLTGKLQTAPAGAAKAAQGSLA